MKKMFEYCIYPSQQQIFRLNKQLDLACEIYNSLLDLKQEIWRETRGNLSKFDLDNIIVELKVDNPKWKDIHSHVLHNVSDRLIKAYDNFFRRVKEKKAGKKVKVGYPRFKKSQRYKSITFPDSGFKFISQKRLHIDKIGNIPIVLSRKIDGKVKTMTVKIKNGKWYVVFCCDVDDQKKKRKHTFTDDKIIGIDVGLNQYVKTSNDVTIDNPRLLQQSERRIKRLQRRVSRKVKGSSNRRKAVQRLALCHEDILNRRNDFLHKTSRFLADNYDEIDVENLNITGMMKNHRLAKYIADASWGRLLQMTCYKVEETGGRFVVGDRFAPTTKECCRCHVFLKLSLSDRIYNCPICGNKIDRDLNSAINIKNRAGRARIYACGDTASTLQQNVCKASSVNESRTTCGKISL
jgi:putative transposase